MCFFFQAMKIKALLAVQRFKSLGLIKILKDMCVNKSNEVEWRNKMSCFRNSSFQLKENITYQKDFTYSPITHCWIYLNKKNSIYWWGILLLKIYIKGMLLDYFSSFPSFYGRQRKFWNELIENFVLGRTSFNLAKADANLWDLCSTALVKHSNYGKGEIHFSTGGYLITSHRHLQPKSMGSSSSSGAFTQRHWGENSHTSIKEIR